MKPSVIYDCLLIPAQHYCFISSFETSAAGTSHEDTDSSWWDLGQDSGVKDLEHYFLGDFSQKVE